MKTKWIYILSGVAVSFFAALLIVVLSSGQAATKAGQQNTAFPAPSSVDSTSIKVASQSPEQQKLTDLSSRELNTLEQTV